MFEVKGPDGQVTGPHSKDVVVRWIQAGELPRHAQVRKVGEPGFTSAEMHGELRHMYRSEGKGSKMIPTKNPSALAGYYLGFIGCLPLIGFPLAMVSMFFAIKGLKAYNAQPEIYGKTHAIVGIVCASVGLAINLFLMIGFLAAMASGPS